MSAICDDCGKPFDNGDSPFMLTCDECLRAEGVRLAEEAANFRNPTPPPIPVRGGYYLTECGHCGWIGSSEQCLPSEEDVVCPVCCSVGCEDEPSEKDTEVHGEAVMQRIIAAEAARDRLLIAFHDAIRRPLGVTPDSGAEFYDQRMADEAEERRAAQAPTKAASAAWPSGCIKPNSCSRHRGCMYAGSVEQCRHFGKDLAAEVEAALAAKSAPPLNRSETDGGRGAP